jgi:inner membrane protein CreD
VRPARLVAIAFIYVCTAVAWFTLGATVVNRTGASDAQLAAEVTKLWGGRHRQVAPAAWYERNRIVTEELEQRDKQGRPYTVTRSVTDRIPAPLLSSRVTVRLALDQRRKGLLWYDTYGVTFAGRYEIHNPDAKERQVFVHFPFPSAEALYDDFRFALNGNEAPPATNLAQGLTTSVLLPAGGKAQVEVGYRSRGLGEWTYAFVGDGLARVEDFQLQMQTDFRAIDFPAGTLSPTRRTARDGGVELAWEFRSLVTGQAIGMDPPDRLNPGPLAARITFFAPVSLLFFLTVMVILGALRGESLHPMNYFFVAAAFFSFHLLLAYLVDHLDVHLSFLIASATSVLLVVSYLRLVGGLRFAVFRAGLAQVVFLVLFSYAFFFEGLTGLTVTVGAVLTLFTLMQLTGRVDWNGVFGARATRAS